MRLTLVVIVLTLLLPICAHAQVQFGIGARAGILGYNQSEIDTHALFWGAQARARLVKYFAAELSYQKRSDNFQINRGSIELVTKPLELSAIFYPLAVLPVSPYIVGGTGWYFLDITVRGDLGLPYITGEGTLSLTEHAPHIGVGVEGFIGDHFSVGADVRKVFLSIDNQLINYKLDAYFVNFTATYYF
jgi:hypothetical protein